MPLLFVGINCRRLYRDVTTAGLSRIVKIYNNILTKYLEYYFLNVNLGDRHCFR